MPKIYKVNAAVILVLAALFHWLFLFTKHDAALSKIIPFGDDPFDAVGTFGVVIGILIALLSLARAFRPYRAHAPAIEQKVYLVRAQTVVVLAVLITLVSDAVAMARHPTTWMAAPQRNELLALLGGMVIVAIAIELLIRRTAEEIVSTKTPARWTRAVIVGLIAILILAVYPEHMIEGTATHLLTVVAGALILFVPMRPLLMALVPYDTSDALREATAGTRGSATKHRWGIVLLGGVLLGLFLFAGEMSEGDGEMPLGRVAFIASVFVGLTTTGLVIAYAFLGSPLGFGRRR